MDADTVEFPVALTVVCAVFCVVLCIVFCAVFCVVLCIVIGHGQWGHWPWLGHGVRHHSDAAWEPWRQGKTIAMHSPDK